MIAIWERYPLVFYCELKKEILRKCHASRYNRISGWIEVKSIESTPFCIPATVLRLIGSLIWKRLHLTCFTFAIYDLPCLLWTFICSQPSHISICWYRTFSWYPVIHCIALRECSKWRVYHVAQLNSALLSFSVFIHFHINVFWKTMFEERLFLILRLIVFACSCGFFTVLGQLWQLHSCHQLANLPCTSEPS